MRKTGAASNREISAQVRAYIASLPAGSRRLVGRIRQDIRAAAPRATEVFSYGVPGFRFEGRPLVWYGAWKSHVSLYPLGAALQRANAAALDGCGFSKGTIRFPLSNPPSSSLVKRLVKGRLAEMR